MAMGMSYEQYWYGDPQMVQAYYRAEKLRQKKADEQAWWLGVYVQKALLSTVGNAFLDRGETPYEYPDVPLLQEKDRERDEAKRQREEERERLKLVAYLNQVMMTRKQQEG